MKCKLKIIASALSMVRLGNFSATGIHSREERALLTSYLVIIFLSSSVGDSIILLSTIKYNAIKLHRVIVVVIQHMAVNDLLQTLFLVLPQIVSLQADEWILGLFLCHLSEHVSYVCNVVMATLSCILVGSKLLVVIYPLNSMSWRRRSAHKLCALCWILGVIQPQEISNIFLTETDSVYFDYYDYTCDYDSLLPREPNWLRWFSRISAGVGLLVVSLILMATSAVLLVTARRSAVRRGECLRWRGVLTVVMTTAIYLISFMPYFNVNSVQNRGTPNCQVSSLSQHHRQLFCLHFDCKEFQGLSQKEVFRVQVCLGSWLRGRTKVIFSI